MCDRKAEVTAFEFASLPTTYLTSYVETRPTFRLQNASFISLICTPYPKPHQELNRTFSPHSCRKLRCRKTSAALIGKLSRGKHNAEQGF